MNQLSFDLVLHLAGEQVLPNYMGVKLCEARRHLVVATEQTSRLVPRIETELRRQSWKGDFYTVKVPAYDYAETHRNFSTAAGKADGRRVGFNVTGGTKPMFAAALDFCRETDAVPFYVDTAERLVRFLAPPYQDIPLPKVFTSVAEFAHLAGQQVQEEGFLPSYPPLAARAKLAAMMWQHRNLVRRWIQAFAESTKAKLMNSKTPPPVYAKALAEMRTLADGKAPELMPQWDGIFPPDGDWRKAAVFAAGGWFEEHVFHRLAPLLADGTLKDLRLGFTPTWEDQAKKSGPFTASQEFDASFTDGYGLTIIECKAGTIKQEHVQKLENLRLAFGGSFGRAAIVSANPPDLQTRKRLQHQRKIAIFAGKGVDSLTFRATDFKPGETMEHG